MPDTSIEIVAGEKTWRITGGGETVRRNPPALDQDLVCLRAFASNGFLLEPDGCLAPQDAQGERDMLRHACNVGDAITALLPDAAREAIAGVIVEKKTETSTGIVRIVVSGTQADSALLVPWEFLVHEGRFPVAEGEIHLVREVKVECAGGLPEPPLPFSVVAHLAAPQEPGLPELDLEATAYRMALALDGISDRTRFTEMGTLDDLVEAVRAVDPVLLHFSGHGQPGTLVFENEVGGGEQITVGRITSALRDAAGHLPAAIWLSCCFGAGQTDARSPVIAAELHREGVPQVLGYFGRVPDPLAVEVDRTLFEELIETGSTLRAVLGARARTRRPIETDHGPATFPLAWSLLGLYHRGKDVPLVDGRPLDATKQRALARQAITLRGIETLQHGFIGRRRLLAGLRKLIRDGERVIGLWGMGGLGKTALMVRLCSVLAGGAPRWEDRIVVLPLAERKDGRAKAPFAWLLTCVDAALHGHPARPEEWDAQLAAVDQSADRGAGLARALLAASRDRTIYVDNAEALQSDPADPPDPAGVPWNDPEVAQFFETLFSEARSSQATVLATTRYRPTGAHGSWSEIEPCTKDEVFRMTGWWPSLRRLHPALRSELATERLAGHPRAVGWADALVEDAARWSGTQLAPNLDAADVRCQVLDPALAGLPARVEADLILDRILARLPEETRSHLGECSAIGLPVPLKVVGQLGTGDDLLRSRGLLTRYEGAAYAVHPFVRDALERQDPQDTWTPQGRAVLGRYWIEVCKDDAPPHFWEEALGHLIPAKFWDDAMSVSLTLSNGYRQCGLVRQRVELLERLDETTPWPERQRGSFLHVLNELSDALLAVGRYDEAETAARESVWLAERIHPTRVHPDVAVSLHFLANVLESQEKYKDAEDGYRESIAIKEQVYNTREHPEVATSLHGLANVLEIQGQYKDAEDVYRESIAIMERTLGSRCTPAIVVSLANLAGLLLQRPSGVDDAISLVEEAFETACALGAFVDAVQCGVILCRALLRGERPDEARARRAEVAQILRLFPADHPLRVQVEQKLQL